MTARPRLPTMVAVLPEAGSSHDSARELLDRVEIADLLMEYCARCDLNDPDGVAACFTDDCVAFYGPGPPAHGRAIRREVAARDLALFESTSHHLSNLVVEFECPDRARAQSYVYAWHRPHTGGQDWELHAQYHDVVVRTETGWQILERRMLVTGTVGFPADWAWLHVPRH